MCRSATVSLIIYLFNNIIMAGFIKIPIALSIIHVNDFHASYEPIEESGDKYFVNPCIQNNKSCIGGYARILHTVHKLVQSANEKRIPYVYLNGGDNFGGSLWYTIGRWNLTVDFLNMFPIDAMVLGGHEFDHGIDGLAPFVRKFRGPITVCNIDTSKEPSLWSIKKSVIINKSGFNIGIIGAMGEITPEVGTDTGQLRFLNVTEEITKEAKKLTSKNVKIIIVLSHCGYNVDKIIANRAGDLVDIIVGSHSHTFLSKGGISLGPMKPRGNYPTVVRHASGRKVLIVQAGSFGRYLGNLSVNFSHSGQVLTYSGSPIYMNAKVPEDKAVLKKIENWKLILNKVKKIVIGKTIRDLTTSNCVIEECTAGNFYTSAILDKYLHTGCIGNRLRSSNISFAIITSGALHNDISKGYINYEQIYNMVPYNVTLAAIVLKGEHVKTLFEESIANYYDISTKRFTYDKRFLQVAGIKVTYDLTKPVNHRVQSMMIRCHSCTGIVYNDVLPDTYYKVITNKNIAYGGFGYTCLVTLRHYYSEFSSAYAALMDYLHKNSPITILLEKRIAFKGNKD